IGTDGRYHYLVDRGNREHLLLRGRVRNNDRIILILPVLILSFGVEHADYAKRKVANSHRLPDGIVAGKQVVGNRLTADAYARRSSNVAFGDELDRRIGTGEKVRALFD